MICAEIARVVLISMHIDAISNGDQCLCLIKYLINLGAVSRDAWLAGLETRANSAIMCPASGVIHLSLTLEEWDEFIFFLGNGRLIIARGGFIPLGVI